MRDERVNGKCFFSGEPARVVTLQRRDGVSIETDALDYWITRQTSLSYAENTQHALTPIQRNNCIFETVRLNREGLIPFWTITRSEEQRVEENARVVLRTLDEVMDRPLLHKDKEVQILNLVAERLQGSANPFSDVIIDKKDQWSLGIADMTELATWIRSLCDKKLLHQDNGVLPNCVRLTPAGWASVYEANRGVRSTNVFVAMAFTDSAGGGLPADLRDCLKTSINALDWNAVIIDEVEHNDGIMDRVIAAIRDSAFVVAELTYQKSGVYYEAGFAKALGLEVIHIVSESDFKSCHFDVRHLNLIVWKDHADLSKKLTSRVLATKGRATDRV